MPGDSTPGGRRAAAPPAAALARCVGDAERFAESVWGRTPLLRSGADQNAFADLLGIADVDHLVTSTGLRAPAFRLVRDGSPIEPSRYLRRARVGSRPISDLADPGKVMAEFSKGATIVLQGLHRYWPPLAAFCRALEQALTHPVQANAYLTPPTSAGLRVHDDAHDVFVLQSHGRKQWVVYWDSDDAEPKDLTLEPGDALYLPRGTRHAARTVEEPSLHVTIGVRAMTWRDVSAKLVEQLDGLPSLREPLPVGYADDHDGLAAALAGRLRELAGAVEKLDADVLAERLSDEFYNARPPLLTGQLCDLLELDRITDDTPLRRRPGTVCALRRRDGRLELLLGDRHLSLPVHAEPAVVIVTERDELSPADLAAHLDEPGRLVLARRLVKEGLLTFVRDDRAR